MRNRENYPENWEDTIRPDILKRDKYKCSECNAHHRQHGYYDGDVFYALIDKFQIEWAKKQGFKVQKIHLQIAHLDQNPNNNDYDNLLCKCPKHHLRFDNKFNTAKRLMRKKRS
jgi:hypothetical protein